MTKQIFKKDFTREHTLFYSFLWSENNQKDLPCWLSGYVVDSIFIKEPNTRLVSTWYKFGELDSEYTGLYANNLKNKLASAPEFIDEIEGKYRKFSDEVYPYLMGKKKIDSLLELQKFCENTIQWWSPMALCYTIPTIDSLSDHIRQKAFAIRSEAQEFTDRIDTVFSTFFLEKYPHHEDLLYVLTPGEIFALDTVGLDTAGKIRERKNGWMIIGNKLYLLDSGKKILERNNYVLEAESIEHQINIIKGTVAQCGVVRGNIKIVLSKHEISEINNGDIMVTIMTTPDYLSAMHKAAAIVTDEGGITCHAAIIARELKKPCIIGTKIATQVLKDGMLVEVDAEKGVVKILKMAEGNQNVKDESK